MQNYRQRGDTLSFTLAVAVASGQLVMCGVLPGIACGNYAANEPGEYLNEGVFDLPAVAADTATAGDPAYMDADGNITATAGVLLVGVFTADKVAQANTATVRLNAVAVLPSGISGKSK